METWGSGTSGSSDGPTDPTVDPSFTRAPRRTWIAPSCRSVTVLPEAVSIETVLPELGTVPANETTPSAGASTDAPTSADMSMPRCWPAAYGWSWSKLKPRST
jgi:hypothetical protein